MGYKVNAWTAYRRVDQATDGLRFHVTRQYQPAKRPALWFNLGCRQATPESAFAALQDLGAVDSWPDEGKPYHRDLVLLPWQETIADLGRVASLWTPADDTGESRLRQSPMPETAALIAQRLASVVRNGLGIAIDGLQPVITWKTLEGFLWLSAAEAVRERHRFKRCRHCATWFRVLRSDALFCSASCRNFREEPANG